MYVLKTVLRKYSDGSFLCEHISTGQTIWLEQREIDSHYKLIEYDTEEKANKALTSIVIKEFHTLFGEEHNSKEIKVVEFTEEINERSNFNLCRFRWFKDSGFTSDKLTYICRNKENPDRDESDKDYPSPEITSKDCINCPLFKTKYIQYPILVSEIIDNFSKNMNSPYHTRGMGDLVKVRYCKDNKTYLGIHLGDGITGNRISHSNQTDVLEISPDTNPAIFVPALKKIVYGYESWWGKIESEEDFKDISDQDIDNVWYVQLLKGMSESKSE
jgi:hypothetical protein